MKQHNSITRKKALTLLLFLSGLALAGCGSSSTGGEGNPNTPPINTCVGTNCYYQTPTNVNKGFYAQSSNMPQGAFVNNGSVINVGHNIGELLADAMGVCNRGYYNGGLADCQTWYNGIYDMVFMVDQADQNKVNIIFRAYPQVGQTWYTYQLPHWKDFFLSMIGMPLPYNPQGVFNPMILQGTIHPINESQGFEIRAYGPQVSKGYNKVLQIQVASGKIEDERFIFQAHWHGETTPFARGTMVKCQTPTCGL